MNYQEIAPLTSRETEVLKLLSQEFSTNEIAKGLFVSSSTIETHRRNLFRKMRVRNVAGLIRKSFEAGILTVEKQSNQDPIDLLNFN